MATLYDSAQAFFTFSCQIVSSFILEHSNSPVLKLALQIFVNVATLYWKILRIFFYFLNQFIPVFLKTSPYEKS